MLQEQQPRLVCHIAAHSVMLPSGTASKLVVIFMHNKASGHEESMRAASANNTDPGQWQHFVQKCHTVVNVTFDEDQWQWHDVNLCAAEQLVNAVTQIAMTSSCSPHQ